MAVDVVALFNAALPGIGAFSFGAMLGWVAYRTLRRQDAKPTLADLGVIASTLLGAAISAVFQLPQLFGAYTTGLGVGFFAYLVVSFRREAAWKRERDEARRQGLPPPEAPFWMVSVDSFMSRGSGARGPAPDAAARAPDATEVTVTTSASRGDSP